MLPCKATGRQQSCLQHSRLHASQPARLAVICKAQSVASRASADLMSLVPWAVKNGIQFAKIKPAIQPGSGRGLVATADIQPGEPIIDVPVSAAIRVFPGCPPALGVPEAIWQQLPWYGQLALTLLAEQRQGQGSKWADYIRQLPAAGDVDVPVVWGEAEVQQLQCAYFIEQVHQQQQDWAALQQQVAPYLSAAGISPEQLQWALCITRSRTFAAPYTSSPFGAQLGWLSNQRQQQEQQQHVLCPMLDLFNHRADVQSECEFYSGFRSSSFRVVASQPWARGQQVYINYGSGSNDVLALQYGFVAAGRNPDDRYIVRCLPAVLEGQGITGGTADTLAEVVCTWQGLDAAAAAQLMQLLPADDGRGSQAAAQASGMLPYAALSSAARAVCAAAVQREMAALGVDAAADTETLQAFEQLPAKEAELASKQADLANARSRLEQVQGMLQAAQQSDNPGLDPSVEEQHPAKEPAAAGDGPSTGVSATGAGDELLGMRDLAQQLCDSLEGDIQDMQALVARWQQLVQQHKQLAVLYRLQKQQLLTGVLSQLEHPEGARPG